MESLGTHQNDHVEIDKKAEGENHKLKEMENEIRWLLENECLEESELLELIDDVHRLGLGYKFRKHTEKAIRSLLISIPSWQANHKIIHDLHDCALCFRLARQLGLSISADIFERFKDSNGDFKETLATDIRGMLSLHEASYLGFDGESILEEAREFTGFHLDNIMLMSMDTKSAIRVSHALELPFHYRMQRLEARWNIEMYDGKNELLHHLAIMDFNMVQSVHQHELQQLSRWWREVGLANKLSFARDRLMESFMWTVGMVPQPQFGKCRVGLTKVVNLITVLDDIYDVYASPQDLQHLTHAVHRWDVNSVDHLPDYMKIFFLALYNTVNELAYDTLKEHDQVVISQLRQVWADLCDAFLKEAKWRHNNHIPKFDEYLNHGWVSSSGAVLLTHAYFLVTQNVTDEAIKHFSAYGNNLMRSPCTIFRLANDLSSSQEDGERGEVAKAVSCYMNETGSLVADAHGTARGFSICWTKGMGVNLIAEVVSLDGVRPTMGCWRASGQCAWGSSGGRNKNMDSRDNFNGDFSQFIFRVLGGKFFNKHSKNHAQWRPK
ncbi:terpene synthase 02 [Striga hermonthica]|uniref:Terpene synthase 02 n=1 Tax=Striga hermonthica TaxID=68872 RepID=A0A9N7NIU8_STRHE|nr:terpene synthase 02 [Striga hermonthica]